MCLATLQQELADYEAARVTITAGLRKATHKKAAELEEQYLECLMYIAQIELDIKTVKRSG